MKRREFVAAAAVSLSATGLARQIGAQELYKEGAHYERLPEKVATTSSGDNIEVVEVFWYGCPHCFNLEPRMEAWLERKPDNVDFVRIPGVGGRWTLGAAAYYVAEKLGILEQTHQAMFDAIHVQRRQIANPDQLAAFFAEHGVERAEFDKALNSFDVKTNIQRAQELMRRYRITGVPALIVDGEFKTGSLDVVDYLVRQKSGSS